MSRESLIESVAWAVTDASNEHQRSNMRKALAIVRMHGELVTALVTLSKLTELTAPYYDLLTRAKALEDET